MCDSIIVIRRNECPTYTCDCCTISLAGLMIVISINNDPESVLICTKTTFAEGRPLITLLTVSYLTAESCPSWTLNVGTSYCVFQSLITSLRNVKIT